MFYLEAFEELVSISGVKEAFEDRVEQIMERFTTDRQYYIAAFPFHNKRKALLYNLVHGTGNIAGFKLFKESAWKVFEGHSTNTKNENLSKQLCFNFENPDSRLTQFDTDESCYNITDIAQYLSKKFLHQKRVPLAEVWKALDMHPIFPSEGFRPEIRHELTSAFGAKIFTDLDHETKKCKTYVSFY